MSTHNIGFYEEISKIVPKLSSNIIIYAPYLFLCTRSVIFVKEKVAMTRSQFNQNQNTALETKKENN